MLPPLPAPGGAAPPTERWLPGPAPERLAGLIEAAFTDCSEARFGQSLAALVVHQGRLVAARYAPGVDAHTTLISWSMAKSITHALVGILVGEGRLVLHDPAPVPEWRAADDPRGAITLDHLLAMRPGLLFNEDYVDAEASHCIEMLFGTGAADMAAYAAGLPAVATPDTTFNYSSGTTNIIARIIAGVVGRDEVAGRWMRAALFDPLGMRSAAPKFDGAGTFVGSSFLYATAEDFARFGLLYLRDGVWGDRRLLPEGWVDHARRQRSVDPDGVGYGSHWWIWDTARGIFAAQGYETQRIVLVPDRDLLVVRLGKTPTELGPNVDAWIGDLIGCFG